MSARLLTAGLILALVLSAAAAWGEDEPSEAEAKFRAAFADTIGPRERVEALEKVAKDHPDSPWADDALWALGEAARQQRMATRTIYYWQYLMGCRPDFRLEDFTRRQAVYRRSPLPGLLYLLRVDGSAYSRSEAKVVSGEGGRSFVYKNVETFDPAPLLVWEGLGDGYRRLKRPLLAAKAYAKAVELAPEKGEWAVGYRQRLKEKRQTVRSSAGAGGRPQGERPQKVAAQKREPDRSQTLHPKDGKPEAGKEPAAESEEK